MPINNRIAAFHPEITAWRRALHAHPEICYEEKWTSDFVAKKLEEFGIEVHRGLAGTGVVGTLKGNRPGKAAIGLRADMDALPMTEKNTFDHASQIPGRMHACGHDGHTAMLLGAAKYLAETRNFAGTVQFIFQPAEEGGAGARKMIEEGLFEKFPVDAVFGMHNWPGVPVGTMSGTVGPIMAATDTFEITVHGKGGHAAHPEKAVDPIVIGAQLVTALQSIASRQVDPIKNAVVSITQFHAGSAYNVIPDDVVLRGTIRTFDPDVRKLVETSMKQICEGICAGMGGSVTVEHRPGYPATVNSARETEVALGIAERLLGAGNVDRAPQASMGGEDFAYMLQVKPGAYLRIGNGPDTEGRKLHQTNYDFNDEVLPIGASYWAQLVEQTLTSEA
ncbi:MAG TPA: M20 aminoacylase family protein [Stellaceae bacterium]|nr:M20 aminoacylase family protein [Stellaceae bacterium]